MRSSHAPAFDEYLTVKQAAQLLGVSPDTLRNWDRAGKFTPSRHPINGYRLYRRSDLDRLLQELHQPQSQENRL